MSLLATSNPPEFCKTCIYSINIPSIDTATRVSCCLTITASSDFPVKLVRNNLTPDESLQESNDPDSQTLMLCQHYGGDRRKIKALSGTKLIPEEIPAGLQKGLNLCGIYTIEQLIEVGIEGISRLFPLSLLHRGMLEGILRAHNASKRA